MTEQEFMEILAFGREQHGIEFKGPGTKSSLLAKVVRAVLSMANKRDGGMVIIGIDEDSNGQPVPTGLSASELATWSYDDFADSLSRYADPNVSFDLDILEYQASKFIIINVNEFDDIPILCKKDHSHILREGACYIRTRRKPETSEIPSQSEMRDLLDLATVKALRKYFSTAHTAGLELSVAANRETDYDKFDAQLGDLWKNK
ncbi:MAG: ATP-binding protein [Ardenticatenaceae bacterium]|nr:ATP-binding protein [Ardenticatenaceae bacterium]